MINKKPKKITALLLAIATLVSMASVSAVNISATESTAPVEPGEYIENVAPTEPLDQIVYSPEFPSAYIVQFEGLTRACSADASADDTVSAMVFVEEEYGFDTDHNPVITSSRLLSKEEVMEIGIENFEDHNEAMQYALTDLAKTGAATNSRGKLTITFSGSHTKSGSSVTCKLNGKASWSGGINPLSGSTTPALGSDYMGIAWSGAFTTKSSSIQATSNISAYKPEVLNMCAATANAGRVWEFSEYWPETIMGQGVSLYLKDININMTLYKAKATGGGNTAEAILKYIHTYEAATGSVSIQASKSDVSVGFSLSSVSKQWSIVCTLTGFPY